MTKGFALESPGSGELFTGVPVGENCIRDVVGPQLGVIALTEGSGNSGSRRELTPIYDQVLHNVGRPSVMSAADRVLARREVDRLAVPTDAQRAFELSRLRRKPDVSEAILERSVRQSEQTAAWLLASRPVGYLAIRAF